VIFSEEMVGGRERVTVDEERVLRGAVKIAGLSGCKNFVGKRERDKFIFNAFVDLKPMQSGFTFLGHPVGYMVLAYATTGRLLQEAQLSQRDRAMFHVIE